MSPRAWKNSESYDLPPHAAELVKPTPYMQQQLQRQLVHFEEPTPRQRAALDATEPDVYAPGTDGIDATEPTPTSQQKAQRTAHGSALAFSTPTPPPRTAEEAALIAGQLSGARACQALLQGDLKPTSFGRCVANMPQELLREWLDVRPLLSILRPHWLTALPAGSSELTVCRCPSSDLTVCLCPSSDLTSCLRCSPSALAASAALHPPTSLAA